jgi:hypothetical protein
MHWPRQEPHCHASGGAETLNPPPSGCAVLSMKLSDAKPRNLRTPGRYFNGGGRYVEISPTATATTGRHWRLKYRHAGKER